MGQILIVKRKILFENQEFQGFCPIIYKDFSLTIKSNYEYKERTKELENNPLFKQVIPYVWIVNPKTKKVFLYKRSVKGEENRLHNKYSGGIGGHIDKETEEHSENPVIDAMMRELKEEVKVGQVHFGVVALAETEENVSPAMHMDGGKFYTIEEVESLILSPDNELESWSKFSWPFVKGYLES
ncbi:NUDIX domain-containing protein [Candidatus Pacearchaeota archaeon]|nr:NUDIX domain-containing protein [Candidatus Pacearchaeota archaeon]